MEKNHKGQAIDAAMDEQRRKVVEQLAVDMSSGKKNWMKPWRSGFAAQNPVSGSVYSGMNRLHLAYVARCKEFKDPRWVTYQQARSKGWQVRKGEKGTRIEVWKSYTVGGGKADEDGIDNQDTVSTTPRTFLKRVRTYTVFNLEQVDGAPEYHVPEDTELEDSVCEIADKLIASSRCEVSEFATDVACYYPDTDKIAMPLRSAFMCGSDFVATLSHEMTHSTGHPSCLNRSLNGRFGSKEYAFEELVAELGSLFVTSELGVDGQAVQDGYDNHVAYLQSWASRVMADDTAEEATKVLFMAAGHAEKARVEIMRRYNALCSTESENSETQAA